MLIGPPVAVAAGAVAPEIAGPPAEGLRPLVEAETAQDAADEVHAPSGGLGRGAGAPMYRPAPVSYGGQVRGRFEARNCFTQEWSPAIDRATSPGSYFAAAA